MTDTGAGVPGAGAGDGKDKQVGPVVQPQLEVRTVWEFGGANSWPMLTRTNYGEWAVHMKWKLCTRKWWAAVETGNAGEEAEVGVMEALMASTPSEYHEALGTKYTAKEAWEMLASFRVGSEQAKRAKAQQLCREFDDLRFKSGETVEDFTLRLQSIASQFVGFREVRLVNKESRHPGGDTHVLCFVDFDNPTQATVALEALQGYKFDEHDRESAHLWLQFSCSPGSRSAGGPRGRR